MKPMHIAMGVALVIAAGLVVFGDKTPDVAEPVERAARAPVVATAARAPAVKAGVEPVILRLLPRDELLGESEGGALFGSQNWNPPVISKIRHHRLPVGASLLIRMHEVSDLSIRDLRYLMGDRRNKFRISDKQFKPKEGESL